MQRSSSATSMNKRSLTRDSLWDMSEQLNEPMPRLSMSPQLRVMVAPGPPVTVQRNAEKTETRTRTEAKSVGLPRPRPTIRDIGFALAAQPPVLED
eukprot:562122-Pyramimonas_sp.AAC.1